jgi:hypothetical protein
MLAPIGHANAKQRPGIEHDSIDDAFRKCA